MMFGALGRMFDFNRDGRLDSWERASMCMFLDDMEREEQREARRRYELDLDDDFDEDEDYELFDEDELF